MNILVVGDCHGVKPDIDEEAEKADIILATGDICGDSDEMRNAMFQSMDSEQEWWDILGREKAREMVERSLQEGKAVIEYLDSFGKPVFLVPGNWDWIGEENWAFLKDNRFQDMIDDFRNVQNINNELVTVSGYSFIGYGPCSGPEVPQYEDDKPGEEELQEMKKDYREKREEISELFRDAESPVIFLSHNVPHDTRLDRIENPESPADGRHYGSLVVRDMLEEFEPVLSVAGHIHEGYGMEEVKDTAAINAGLNSSVFVELGKEEIDAIFKPPTES